jgi:hypothetical protein
MTEINNRAFVSTETLSTPLTSAIQSNKPELALLMLKEGKFRVHMPIPHTAETPLNMATTARAYTVAHALMTAYNFGNHELDAAQNLFCEVENEHRIHAKEPIDEQTIEEPITQYPDEEPSTSTVATQRLIDEIALNINNTYVMETEHPFKDLVSNLKKGLRNCTTGDTSPLSLKVPNTVPVLAYGNV